MATYQRYWFSTSLSMPRVIGSGGCLGKIIEVNVNDLNTHIHRNKKGRSRAGLFVGFNLSLL